MIGNANFFVCMCSGNRGGNSDLKFFQPHFATVASNSSGKHFSYYVVLRLRGIFFVFDF